LRSCRAQFDELQNSLKSKNPPVSNDAERILFVLTEPSIGIEPMTY
jgi:hypothetical protein